MQIHSKNRRVPVEWAALWQDTRILLSLTGAWLPELVMGSMTQVRWEKVQPSTRKPHLILTKTFPQHSLLPQDVREITEVHLLKGVHYTIAKYCWGIVTSLSILPLTLSVSALWYSSLSSLISLRSQEPRFLFLVLTYLMHYKAKSKQLYSGLFCCFAMQTLLW